MSNKKNYIARGIGYLMVVVLPVVAHADCNEMPDTRTNSRHFSCSNGTEFKIVESTGREPAVAKIKLPGAFDTSGFSATYVTPGKIVQITGEYGNGSRPAQTLYAFLDGSKLAWVSVSRAIEGGKLVSTVTHNLTGSVQQRRLNGEFKLPIPSSMQLVKRSVTVPSAEQVYARLGL